MYRYNIGDDSWQKLPEWLKKVLRFLEKIVIGLILYGICAKIYLHFFK